jgi:nicotinamide mononucleotide transporter
VTSALIESLRFEEVSVLLAAAYLALAIRQSLWCWPAALISVALWAVVVLDARLYMDFALQIFYFAMGIYGWQQWRSAGERRGLRVQTWPLSRHAVALGFITGASLIAGLVLRRTDAAFPFLDSLTSVGAVIATFMVARKVLENWIYWFVIDSIYVFLYLARDLDWYAGLYLVYLVMIVFGFRAWWRSLRDDRAHGDALATR